MNPYSVFIIKIKTYFEYRNADIRIIKGNLDTAITTLQNFFNSNGFFIDTYDSNATEVNLAFVNKNKSFLRLFMTSKPHKFLCNITKFSNNQIKIHIFPKLFIIYRICFYIFVYYGFKKFGELLQISHDSYFKLPAIIAIIVFFIVLLVTLKYLRYVPTLTFADKLYSEDYFPIIPEVVVKSKIKYHPDSFFVILIFFGVTLHFINIIQLIHISSGRFLLILIGLALILAIIYFIGNLSPIMFLRLTILLIPISLCFLFLIYGFIPNLTIFLSETALNINNIINNNVSYQTFIMTFIAILLSLFTIFALLLITIFTTPLHILKEAMQFKTSHSESDYYNKISRNLPIYVYSPIILILWFVMTISNIAALNVSITLFSKVAFGNYNFASNKISIGFYNFILSLSRLFDTYNITLNHKTLKLFILIYSAPLIIIMMMFVAKNAKKFWQKLNILLFEKKFDGIDILNLNNSLYKICKFFGASKPVLRIVSSGFHYAYVQYLGFPFYKNILIISDSLYKELIDSMDEFEALIAHEVYHIKKHTIIKRFLSFLSSYSLFGSGFLSMLQNSYQIERNADLGAVKWLMSKTNDKGFAISTFKSLLERIEEYIAIESMNSANDALHLSMTYNRNYVEYILAKYRKSSFVKKFFISFMLIYRIYFDDDFMFYFYPSFKQRINWIEELRIQK